MRIVVELSEHFQRSLTGNHLPKGLSRIFVEGTTVRGALDNLIAQLPQMRQWLFYLEDETSIRRFVHVYLNGRELRSKEELDTEIHEGDSISLVPDVA